MIVDVGSGFSVSISEPTIGPGTLQLEIMGAVITVELTHEVSDDVATKLLCDAIRRHGFTVTDAG